LRHGSLLGAVVRDGIATVTVYDGRRIAAVVQVSNNAAYFHTNHSAPAAAHLRLVFKDVRGQVVPARTFYERRSASPSQLSVIDRGGSQASAFISGSRFGGLG
jgi:hypothetical protein